MEIIPNWHPIFVHFTVALLSISALLFTVHVLMPDGDLKQQYYTVARWNLWLGAGFVVVTLATGWYAYNTVTHDDPSHLAMTDHRNWAFVTATVFLVLAVWSWRIHVRHKIVQPVFALAMLAGTGLLGATAWHGGELVFRHGLGVMSLPQPDNNAAGDGHQHNHGVSEKGPTNTDNNASSMGHGDHAH